MSRKKRAAIAAETLQICESGTYISHPDGVPVDLQSEFGIASEQTRTYCLEEMPPRPPSRFLSPATIEVSGETTFEAISRACKVGRHVGCLNFASAKNPGGGFLGGSQAQEEALSRSSSLYPCLETQFEFYYQPNRANDSSLYLDLAIVSPFVPFFRDDDANLLAQPLLATVITAPAPNAGAVLRNEPENEEKIRSTLARRAEMVLRAASIHEIDWLILGAWGCGVFRNDPAEVAAVFAELLCQGAEYANAFDSIVFAVYDPSQTKDNFRAFEAAFSRPFS